MMTKLLVIEDEPRLRENVVELLELEGFEVASAPDGVQGVKAVQSFGPDLILCDVMMPAMDGYEVLGHLRTDPATSTIPFIFLTALADRDDIRRGMNLGADDYVMKPFKSDDLLRAINSRLAKRKEEVRHQEEALESFRERLSQVIPHELRTPLVAVQGFADVLRSDWKEMPEPVVEEMLDNICKAGKRLERLVENYGLFAQLQLAPDGAHLQMGNVKGCDPVEIVEQTGTCCAERCDRAHDLEAELKSAQIAVLEGHLRKIAEELIDNAFKFSETGTMVTVRGVVDGADYIFSVADEGVGMDRAKIGRMGAFMQFDRDVNEQQGLGLGLALASRLAESYGGQLHVEELQGRGTEVLVRLPLLRRPLTGKKACEGSNSGQE